MQTTQSDRKIIALVGLGLTLFLAGILLLRPVFLVFLDNKLYDSMLRYAPEGKPTGLVAGVDIDEKSLARWGQWPWPRYRLAQLLDRIARQGALAVGMDMVWAERDRLSPNSLREQLKSDLGLALDLSGIPQTVVDYDRILAGTLAAGPFVLGYFFEFGPKSRPAIDCVIPPLPLAWVKQSGAPNSFPVFSASGLICNLPRLSRAAGAAGFFNALPDTDGILRRAPLIIKYGKKYYPSLGLALALRAIGGQKAMVVVDSGGPQTLRAGPLRAPLGERLTALIKFRGPPGTMPLVSALDVLNSPKKAASLKGRIVIIGSTAAGLKDLRATPLGPVFPGLEVQTTIVDNLLAGDFLYRPRWAPGAEVMAAILAGLLITALLCFLRPLWCTLFSLALAGGVTAFSLWLLMRQGAYFSPLVPLANILGNLSVLSLAKFFVLEKRRSFLKAAFSHYVSPQVVERIVESNQGLSLSGERKVVSILFSDIRGFTAISEKLSPADVGELLKSYLTPMTKLITGHQGTVDKFIGDAIMAFWNAPLEIKGHQALALDCALAMLDKLHEVNPGLEERFGVGLKIGLGLHSGPVRVGNMGSEDLFDYTVIGDAVNLASRLESLTKKYGLPLLLSRDLCDACGPGPIFQEVDRVRVVGKTKPVTIYTAYSENRAGELQEELALHARGLELYAKNDFTAAGVIFNRIIKDHRDILLYRIYAERCLEMTAMPPDENWDHVFDYHEK